MNFKNGSWHCFYFFVIYLPQQEPQKTLKTHSNTIKITRIAFSFTKGQESKKVTIQILLNTISMHIWHQSCYVVPQFTSCFVGLKRMKQFNAMNEEVLFFCPLKSRVQAIAGAIYSSSSLSLSFLARKKCRPRPCLNCICASVPTNRCNAGSFLLLTSRHTKVQQTYWA